MDGWFEQRGLRLLVLLLPLYVSLGVVRVMGDSPEYYSVNANGGDKEQDLPVCESGLSVCNVIHIRLWFKPLVVRFCRCPQGECPTGWNESDADGSSQHLNIRAQLKLCPAVPSISTCKNDEEAVLTTVKDIGFARETQLKVLCRCPKPNYYKHITTHTVTISNRSHTSKEIYSCKPLTNCETGEFCAYITEDMSQPYFICTCPPNHVCLRKNSYKLKGKELLYDGMVYKGICTPWIKSSSK